MGLMQENHVLHLHLDQVLCFEQPNDPIQLKGNAFTPKIKLVLKQFYSGGLYFSLLT